MRFVQWMVWIFLISATMLALSCNNEDEPDSCERYCGEMSDCYRLLDQPFSTSECKRSCYDNMERYASVGCKARYVDLIECKTDLSCSDANNVSEDCAPESEDLVDCVD